MILAESATHLEQLLDQKLKKYVNILIQDG